MIKNYPIVVFSHLSWDFVYQRPQHLLSRLAANRWVIFIEEPTYEANSNPRWEFTTPAPNVLVCRSFVNADDEGVGFTDEQMAVMEPMVKDLLAREEIHDYVVWMYTPMALPLAQSLTPKAVVFDIMDELSAFEFAPPVLVEREAELLQWADVVFTGGPSLYKAKLGRHANLHCFPSSVDASHFAQARTLSEPADQASLPHPRLGFYGVIDERMDLSILDAMAVAHPEWQIVMVGPILKIDPTLLPKHDNLHFVGGRSYGDLPRYLAGWDVCLLPFALNNSTKFISPTKTLEYMAAGLPIVSTPITDVAEPYGEIVYLGRTPEQFILACEHALDASEEELTERRHKANDVLAHTSWDATARSMEKLIEAAIRDRTPAVDLSGAGILTNNYV
ncbi:MAG: glycosyltransferase [Chloroflexota bacterium]